ncbi:MAG: hypothetical protein HYZ14_13180 [Bacteroidetes bacterium]|nr:hypothetical protein [Bacteroidota bacterium]
MKVFSYISAFFGVAAIAAALYLMFVAAPAADGAETLLFGEHPESFYGSTEHLSLLAQMDLKTDLGIIVMFSGILALLLGVMPVIKKQKAGWIGVLAGLAAFLIGAAYGTHMFS